MKEIWKEVPGTEFEASSLGRLRKYISAFKHSNGYLQVKVGFGRKSKTRFVHRLVAAAFHGTCPPILETHRVDGNKTNNRPQNLKYVSHKKNILELTKTGKGCIGHFGKKNHATKLSDKAVANIRNLARQGVARKVLATRYSVSLSHLSGIIGGTKR